MPMPGTIRTAAWKSASVVVRTLSSSTSRVNHSAYHRPMRAGRAKVSHALRVGVGRVPGLMFLVVFSWLCFLGTTGVCVGSARAQPYEHHTVVGLMKEGAFGTPPSAADDAAQEACLDGAEPGKKRKERAPAHKGGGTAGEEQKQVGIEMLWCQDCVIESVALVFRSK